MRNEMLDVAKKLITAMQSENHGIVLVNNEHIPHVPVYEMESIDMYYHGERPANTIFELAAEQILINEEALNLLFSWAISNQLLGKSFE